MVRRKSVEDSRVVREMTYIEEVEYEECNCGMHEVAPGQEDICSENY